jgi:phospholipid/cholesterol/gamma-HCH transport system substrate-binding protein
MPKAAPTLGRILAMVVFALSCFGIVIFLWLSFGGPIPLKPEKWRFQARLPESALLAKEADVRLAGLNIGKVKKKTFQRSGGTLVEMEIDSEFAPLPRDTRAILRQKTLLGQIYVELTPGTRDGPKLDEGDTLPVSQVEKPVELDEVIRTFDPETRRNFRGWMRDLGKALDNRGSDLNDAIGNFKDFAVSGSEVLRVLDEEDPALRRLVKNTGIALAAVNEREGQLRQLIVNANDFFGALASRNDALAETIRVFPTFLDESRATFQRLERFSRDTRPLVRDLIPVAERLQPTLRDVGRFAPDLKRLFRDLDPLIEESDDTLPHAARFLTGAEPVLENLHVYLPELNPILSIFNFEQQQIADFITIGGGTLNGTLPGVPGEGPRHVLKQFGMINSRGIGVAQSRPEYERGNAYPSPNYYKRVRPLGIYESFDCKPAGGQKKEATSGSPPCFVQPKSLFDGRRFPRLGKGDAPLRPPPQDNAGTEPAQP